MTCVLLVVMLPAALAAVLAMVVVAAMQVKACVVALHAVWFAAALALCACSIDCGLLRLLYITGADAAAIYFTAAKLVFFFTTAAAGVCACTQAAAASTDAGVGGGGSSCDAMQLATAQPWTASISWHHLQLMLGCTASRNQPCCCCCCRYWAFC